MEDIKAKEFSSFLSSFRQSRTFIEEHADQKMQIESSSPIKHSNNLTGKVFRNEKDLQ